jgi:hypothetical protein
MNGSEVHHVKKNKPDQTNITCFLSYVEARAKEQNGHEHKWGGLGENQWKMGGVKRGQGGENMIEVGMYEKFIMKYVF